MKFWIIPANIIYMYVNEIDEKDNVVWQGWAWTGHG